MEIRLPRVFKPLFDSRLRYTVLFGGRGGGKSTAVATWSLWEGRRNTHKFLCAREFQNSIADSVYALLRETAFMHGVANEFDWTDAQVRHRGTGSVWIFRGLARNEDSIRSVQGVTACWVEEAHSVSRRSWQVLKPTIRREGSRIVCVLNPKLEDDAVYADLVASDEYAPLTTRIPVNWRDNPYITQTLLDEKDAAEKGDPDWFANEWEGRLLKHSTAQVFKPGEWEMREREVPPVAEPLYGLDVGMTSSPSAAIACWHWMEGDQHHVHVASECYGMGLTQVNMETWLESVYVGGDRSVMCDHQLLTTGDLRSEGGWRVMHAHKFAGSVRQGVRWMKGCFVTVSPKCPNMAREMDGYSYKVDARTEEVLDEFALRQSDHAVDALRYALEPAMRPRRAANPYAGFTGTVM